MDSEDGAWNKFWKAGVFAFINEWKLAPHKISCGINIHVTSLISLIWFLFLSYDFTIVDIDYDIIVWIVTGNDINFSIEVGSIN